MADGFCHASELNFNIAKSSSLPRPHFFGNNFMFRIYCFKVVLFFVLVFSFGRTEAQTSPLFLSDGAPILHSVNPATGVQTSVGSLPSISVGLADFQGELWGIETDFGGPTDHLIRLDQNTGAILQSVPIVGTRVFGEGGFAIRSDGTAFVADSSGVAMIDLLTGIATDISSSGIFVDGLDFDSQDNLFAIGSATNTSSNPGLFQIDQNTGARTLIGNTNAPLESIFISSAGLSFDENDNLFWAINRNLLQVDTTSGQASFLTNLSSGTIPSGAFGLTFVNPVPEPSGAALIVLCGWYGLVRRRI